MLFCIFSQSSVSSSVRLKIVFAALSAGTCWDQEKLSNMFSKEAILKQSGHILRDSRYYNKNNNSCTMANQIPLEQFLFIAIKNSFLLTSIYAGPVCKLYCPCLCLSPPLLRDVQIIPSFSRYGHKIQFQMIEFG